MKRNYITNYPTIEELQRLYREKKGVLHPVDVVDAAKELDSPLHHHFEWDDSVAAQRFRVEQARVLLRNVFVKIELPDGKQTMEQVFVSLTSDRLTGGYRTMVDVMSDADMRNQLIRDAMAEMQLFTERYNSLRELAAVFSAIKKVKKKLQKVA